MEHSEGVVREGDGGPFPDYMTIAEARPALRSMAEAEGHNCPVCDQLAKVYRRAIHATMARELIRLYRVYGQGWCKPIEVCGAKASDVVKLRYWGLLEKQEGRREDGSDRVGLWRITDRGIGFVTGAGLVQKYALIYNGECEGHEGDYIGIRTALGKKFNYDDLMAGM